MSRGRRASGGLLAAVLGLSVACAPEEPGSAEPIVVFHTQNTDDGSVAFSVTTPPPATIRSVLPACEGCLAFLYHSADSTANIVVVGALSTGPIVRLQMANGEPAPWYGVTLRFVARRDYRPRTIYGYGLSVE